MKRGEQLKKIHNEAFELFTKKNIDYGDAFAKYGVIGVLMRIEDKLQRYMSITKNGINLINDESIRDTLHRPERKMRQNVVMIYIFYNYVSNNLSNALLLFYSLIYLL
jgi:hypothetical protein